MFHGGTSFGFGNGASLGTYWPNPTSYDYDAPLSEAGDPTDKYWAVQKVISKYLPLPNKTQPVVQPKMAIGPIRMTKVKRKDDLYQLKRSFNNFSLGTFWSIWNHYLRIRQVNILSHLNVSLNFSIYSVYIRYFFQNLDKDTAT